MGTDQFGLKKLYVYDIRINEQSKKSLKDMDSSHIKRGIGQCNDIM